MARRTQAEQIEFANEQAGLAFFEKALGARPDHRRPQGKRYPLVSVVVIGLMAMVCGSDDAEAMQAWGEANAQWLAGFLRDLTWMTTKESWPDLSFVVKVTRTRETLAMEKTSTEVAYYIGSDPRATAESAARTIRRHWAIETKLHWVLDMAFREDEARHRARNTAQSFTVLRHFALNLIRQDSSRKLGVANSRKRAGWDHAYLLKILAGVNAEPGVVTD